MAATLKISQHKGSDVVFDVCFSICEDDGIQKEGRWPLIKTVDDALELCEEHTTEKLTMFCEDDEKLLCHVCHLGNHK
ncbi:hypothetical protein DPMN_146304 [Dreissena polymorpha]|uniref:B box-type domain-containing protein n=1 Tax=Dreissena polymorpha TaxID=45954 RepID=A0A9D4F5N4_DREPO|nr:hypothetical protein DPMN_146304 [Dreissena polymorpha]